MDCYEVFVKLLSHGRKIGRTCVQIQASSPFMAAVNAENAIEHKYGDSVTSKTIQVSQISRDEFMYLMAA